MAGMLTTGFKPKSTTKKAKSIIRSEIKFYYGDDSENRTYGKNFLKNMKQDADSYSEGRGKSDRIKGKELVNAGYFACYYSQQQKMLNKIYGKRNVDKWDGQKIHNTYGNLIGREYASMLRENKKARLKKKTKTKTRGK